jgi:hypothetical protein
MKNCTFEVHGLSEVQSTPGSNFWKLPLHFNVMQSYLRLIVVSILKCVPLACARNNLTLPYTVMLYEI